ncbi:hypothetical protein SLE2022_020350 [Rubroshorea leprosula]
MLLPLLIHETTHQIMKTFFDIHHILVYSMNFNVCIPIPKVMDRYTCLVAWQMLAAASIKEVSSLKANNNKVFFICRTTLDTSLGCLAEQIEGLSKGEKWQRVLENNQDKFT